jgi:hypothetical protein
MYCQYGYGTIYAAESRFCKGKVVQAKLRGDDRILYKIGVVDGVASRMGLITGQFLDL